MVKVSLLLDVKLETRDDLVKVTHNTINDFFSEMMRRYEKMVDTSDDQFLVERVAVWYLDGQEG